ncbi:hypothetical protein QJS10_CPA06g02247 [Acorus calamus]|uniref:Uncharacterized protein n=1 Tax=Acorus calamus TaxID=4465 RepID=A0AAV9ENT3_ACOCL|nr:hypothetical protein QJS10_CPA06g02247 [Acorus calamus]
MGTSEKKSSHPAPPDDGGRNHRTVYSVPDPIINSEDEKDMEEEEGEQEYDEEDEESEENESDSSW